MNRWLIFALALGVGTACGGETDRGVDGRAGAGPATAQEPGPAGEAGRATDGAAALAETGVVYVDVRTPEEFAAGHVEGAINIPHTEMPQRWGELEEYRDDEIVLYCRSGRRSGIALRTLRDVGFTNLENGGGLTDLQRQGVPTTR